MFNEQFKRECQAAGFPADSYVGQSFVGYGVICKDQDELTRAIRSTHVRVGWDEFPTGGFLLYAKPRFPVPTNEQACEEAIYDAGAIRRDLAAAAPSAN